MKGLISVACTSLALLPLILSVASGEIVPIADKAALREKIVSKLSEHGKINFDDSMTDEMVESIHSKYFGGNIDNVDLSKGFQFGQASKRRKGLTATGWEDSDKQTVLDMHNEYRSDVASGVQTDDGTDGTYPTASNMNYLFWDDALASVAQAYSDTCNWGHNDDRNTQFYSYTDLASFDYPSSNIYMGENIAAMWSSGSVQDSFLTGRVDAWWDEYSLWHYQSYSSSTINGAGHFTQMAWADTRYLGCGFTYCDDSGTTMYYLVCNYYPGGNYLGQNVYTSGTCGANTCDGDRTKPCEDSLCAGCMDPSFVETGRTSHNTDCNDGFEVVDDRPTLSPSSMPSSDPSNIPSTIPTNIPSSTPTVSSDDSGDSGESDDTGGETSDEGGETDDSSETNESDDSNEGSENSGETSDDSSDEGGETDDTSESDDSSEGSENSGENSDSDGVVPVDTSGGDSGIVALNIGSQVFCAFAFIVIFVTVVSSIFY